MYIRASPFALSVKFRQNARIVSCKAFYEGQTYNLDLGSLTEKEIISLMFDGEQEFLIGFKYFTLKNINILISLHKS